MKPLCNAVQPFCNAMKRSVQRPVNPTFPDFRRFLPLCNQ